ncbi:MAG: UDP-N-acetylglucosamine 1-carboxyvinyltransferase [Clostridia bacterium]|nr:UDP-N-acetylglucosamine 1-carboxyvinyltransferase [Clostridia bacterium]
MSNFTLRGGARLIGSIAAQGSKNAALPILAATLLVKEPVRLKNCPRLRDVGNMLHILESLGCTVFREGDGLIVDSGTATNCVLPTALSRELRSSIFLLGSVLSRFAEADAPYPGGCEIGNRPIDLHLQGLRRLNAEIAERGGRIHCRGANLIGAIVDFEYPSVGATENIMLAACRAKGETVIRNAACEPEIVDLQGFLNACGFRVSGAGTPTIAIEGVDEGHGATYRIMPDRIVTGTYLIGAAITRGDVTVTGTYPDTVDALLAKLSACGCDVTREKQAVRVAAKDRPRRIDFTETRPYPGFPTDLQPQLFSLLSVADGTSILKENVFENRFKHAQELKKMGAENRILDRAAIITGVERLHGANVIAHDLRGGAALVLAGLSAEGDTVIEHIERIERGYEQMDLAIKALGGTVARKDERIGKEEQTLRAGAERLPVR